ncbi:MAG: aldehyde dehydrogenase family protein [Gemmatimonadetes bacterium]|nr:aldehyde dehydrogenase family protein [Gemmatimonadota bacterium]
MSAARPREWRLPIAGERLTTTEFDDVVDPFTGELYARVPLAGPAEMERAIAAAVEASRELRALPTHRRVDILLGIVEGIRGRADELAETMTRESGKPIQYARGEVQRALQTFALGADEARGLGGGILPADLEPRTEGYFTLYQRFPIGPVSAIAPFNFPLNLVAHKLSPAYAAGNPVVLKPPMQSPVTSLELAEICFQAGLPPRALSVVHSRPEVAERLATDERFALLSFTGSARVGWHLKNIAGRKRVLLELGGNGGAIVHEDADLEWAAGRCALGAFAMSGQNCIRIQRLLIHHPAYDRFLERFLNDVRRLKWGNPMEEDTVVGPLIDTAAADRVMRWIEEAVDAGAQVLLGGGRHGNVIEPTVLSATRPEMKVEREEIFGPVVTVRACDDFEQALALTNQSDYGLQAGVFTRDVRRIWQAFRELEVGGVIVNDYPMLRVDNYPFGGVKQSGFGREGVRFAVQEMTELKAMVLNLNR